jgi:hypothetical protein
VVGIQRPVARGHVQAGTAAAEVLLEHGDRQIVQIHRLIDWVQLAGVFPQQQAGLVVGVIQRAGGHLVARAAFADALLKAVVEGADGLGRASHRLGHALQAAAVAVRERERLVGYAAEGGGVPGGVVAASMRRGGLLLALR